MNWDQIKQHIAQDIRSDSGEEEADTGSRADQIAEAEALLYDLVSGSTDYVEIQDALQRRRSEARP